MKAYYNENDPKAAAWLRELISAGLIAPGDVDTRSITEISPHELTGYTQQHFFAGIGGWSLALRLAGWPDSRPVRTGSCPCQPFSQAGKGEGEKDARHLWPVFRDLITFGEATVTFGEQVASKAGRQWLARVRVDLEGLGYGVGAADLCAPSVGAPHIRQRLFWVADPERVGRKAQILKRGDCAKTSCERQTNAARGDGVPFGMADGNGERLKRRPESHGKSIQPELETSRRDDTLRCGDACRLVDADGSGFRKQRRAESVSAQQSAAQLRGNAWDRFNLLPCTDGKTRRIESGSFPLADGVPGRVGLLRGYGNAIVPQVAAEFIKAFQEIK